ncbi:MAG: hypothetical protein EP343_05995 [Deltaproteobacteria bacterium]|nr:MAG: hypothetical protein EP343_05995 [Deltaproteobacteria bacterium]
MSSAQFSTESLAERCMEDLAEMEEQALYSDAEQNLYERLIQLQSPMDWEDCEGDAEAAQGLWQKMRTLTDQQIQCSFVVSQLSSLPTVLSDPPGGYI